jgi:hypothetical protein
LSLKDLIGKGQETKGEKRAIKKIKAFSITCGKKGAGCKAVPVLQLQA